MNFMLGLAGAPDFRFTREPSAVKANNDLRPLPCWLLCIFLSLQRGFLCPRLLLHFGEIAVLIGISKLVYALQSLGWKNQRPPR